MPHLDLSEQACLHYIIRRTYGYVQISGARKERDVIALSQFVKGISSGGQVIDFGTGLSKPAVTRALAGLEQKGLVEYLWTCLHCHWQEGQEHTKDDKIEFSGHRARCPRCSKSLSKAYALRALSAKKVIRFLDEYGKNPGKWGFDLQTRRFYQIEKDPRSETIRPDESVLEEEAKRLESLLWYPELVNEVMDQAASTLAN
jgi:hypothetical protein